jgi:uncharacterized membrane protein YhfC
LFMAPEASIVEEHMRQMDHARREFTQGVSYMAEQGNNADVVALMERFTQAMQDQADALAHATQHTKLPAWLLTTVGTLALMVVSGGVQYLRDMATTQARLSTLENRTAAIDKLSSLDAKVDALTGTVTRMEERFNVMMDSRAVKAPQ